MVSSYIRKPQFYPVDTYYFKTYKMKKSILSLLIGGGCHSEFAFRMPDRDDAQDFRLCR